MAAYKAFTQEWLDVWKNTIHDNHVLNSYYINPRSGETKSHS